jgi:hypothetical protein
MEENIAFQIFDLCLVAIFFLHNGIFCFSQNEIVKARIFFRLLSDEQQALSVVTLLHSFLFNREFLPLLLKLGNFVLHLVQLVLVAALQGFLPFLELGIKILLVCCYNC